MVEKNGEDRTVTIAGEVFSITKQKDQFEIVYPSGASYHVTNSNGNLMSFDKEGEILFPIYLYVNGKNIAQTEEEEVYFPSTVVQVAYSEFHSKQGSKLFYTLSIVLLIYGWCGFRYKAFQNYMFKFSFSSMYVRDAEPTEFYYFMCKFGGVAAMIFSIFFLVKSFY